MNERTGHDDKDGERVARAIARAGLASRRTAEEWIAAGRVAVNGAVIHSPALNVTATDRISVDGELLPARERTRLFLYHKPRGLITSHADPKGRPTIFAHLPKDLPRLISVGRLDFNTEGLILLTNDGALARALELPATGWLRRYRVRAHGTVTQKALDGLRAGVTVEGVRYGGVEATIDRLQGSNLWLTFVIREGKNREVRKVLGYVGLTVTRLIRVSFGPFQLGELAEGAVEEVPTRTLREQLGAQVVALSGADFSAPLAQPSHPANAPAGGDTEATRPAAWDERPQRPGRRPANAVRPAREDRADKTGKPRGGRRDAAPQAHAWRRPEDGRPGKKLQRKFRGTRRDDGEERQRASGKPRAGMLTDRKGRAVAVERFGEPPREPAAPERKARQPRRRRSPDRSSGPRPRTPKGR